MTSQKKEYFSIKKQLFEEFNTYSFKNYLKDFLGISTNREEGKLYQ